MWFKTLVAVIALAWPDTLIICLTASSSKNLLIVEILFLAAILAILAAGSTPITRHLILFLKLESRVPSLEPMSTTKSDFSRLALIMIWLAISAKCLIATEELAEV